MRPSKKEDRRGGDWVIRELGNMLILWMILIEYEKIIKIFAQKFGNLNY